MFHKPLPFIVRILQSISAKVLLRSYPNYQPVFKNGKLLPGSDRDCIDRWKLIKSEITHFHGESLLDIGSAEGFYVLEAAKELNCFSLGIDADIRRMAVAQNQLVSEKIMPAGFLLEKIDTTSLKSIPAFDVVIFMSVLHHIMYTHGIEYSKELLKILRDKVKKVMIFEMGQSDEHKMSWAKLLPDMGENPHEWIKNFILSQGYREVVKIGESDSYGKDRRRAIFRVVP